jgi:predicted MFS family arabinose efflux permease
MRSDFANLLAAEAVSNFGSMLSRLAIPWIATLALDVSPLQMGLLVVSDVIAGAIGSLFIGTLVDRFDKRSVMVWTDAGRACVIGLLAVAAASSRISFAMLVGAAAVSGLLTIMFELARSAWIAHGVEAGGLPVRNAQMSMATSISETAAFALGGWVYQAAGAIVALAIDAATYVMSAAFVRKLRDLPTAHAQGGSIGNAARAMAREAQAGIREIARHPLLRTLAAIEVLAALGMSIAGSSYMIFVARDLGFETGTLGMIFATGGIGSLVGAWLATRLGRAWGWRRAMIAGLALLSLGASCIPLAPAAGVVGAVLLIVHQVVGDGGQAIYDVHDRTLRQTLVAADVLARVDAGIRTLGQFGQLAGAVGGGLLGTTFGTRTALAISATLFALAAVALLARPARGEG